MAVICVHLLTSTVLQHTPEVTSASTTATRRTSEDCIQISSIPVRGAPAHQATTPAAASSPQTASLDHHHGLEVIAFSSGSTPALSPQERQRSVANHRESTSSTASNPQDLSSGSLSPWKEFLKRRQAAAAASATAGGTGDIATKTGKSVAPAAITDAETILASLLLPSARKNSRDTVAEERLYIAARNKVHRPRARKRTSSSGARVEGVVTPITAKASTKTRRSSEVPVSFASTPASMASSHYGGVPSGSSSGNNNAQRNHLSSRDYGYSTSNKHSNNSPSTGGMSDYTPPQSASTGTTGSSNLSSPFSPSSSYTTTGQNRPPIGASSKASQMLGLSSSHRSPDMYMSQTTTYHSAHSDGASTLNGNSTGIRHPHYHQDQHSPTTSTGSGGKIVNAPQSHSRMTLKKARSLFSSGGGKNNSKDKSSGSSTPEAGLPSPSITGSMMNVRPMGMGSYGDAYPSVPPAVVGSSSYSNIQSTLLHSKSHGSLQGAMTGSMRPSNPPLPPSHLEDSYHPYAASSRKASHPILPSHSGAKSAAAREAEQDIACPVCLESLSIRLQGEKPHVLPICGHKLHNECFETAYNITVAQALQDSDPRAEGVRRKKRNPIGICGICRSEMRVGDPSEIGKNSEPLTLYMLDLSLPLGRSIFCLTTVECAQTWGWTEILEDLRSSAASPFVSNCSEGYKIQYIRITVLLIPTFFPTFLQNLLCCLVSQEDPEPQLWTPTRYILSQSGPSDQTSMMDLLQLLYMIQQKIRMFSILINYFLLICSISPLGQLDPPPSLRGPWRESCLRLASELNILR